MPFFKKEEQKVEKTETTDGKSQVEKNLEEMDGIESGQGSDILADLEYLKGNAKSTQIVFDKLFNEVQEIHDVLNNLKDHDVLSRVNKRLAAHKTMILKHHKNIEELDASHDDRKSEVDKRFEILKKFTDKIKTVDEDLKRVSTRLDDMNIGFEKIVPTLSTKEETRDVQKEISEKISDIETRTITVKRFNSLITKHDNLKKMIELLKVHDIDTLKGELDEVKTQMGNEIESRGKSLYDDMEKMKTTSRESNEKIHQLLDLVHILSKKLS